MNKQKMEMLKEIFPEEMKRVEAGQCHLCGQAIDPASFRDQLSRREFEISGMCQVCQDNLFADPEADEYDDSEIEEMKQKQNQKYFEADYRNKVENENDECDENDAFCNECKYIDNEGDCDNVLSRHWGECVDGTVRECTIFEQR